MLLPDNMVNGKLIAEALSLAGDEKRKMVYSENIIKLAEKDADIRIAGEVMKLFIK
jgi:hypothetical protein